GCGYAVTMCKSRWDKTSTYPAGLLGNFENVDFDHIAVYLGLKWLFWICLLVRGVAILKQPIK
nr:kinesin motor domain-containing protein [Tanacetum cinerariifolium]